MRRLLGGGGRLLEEEIRYCNFFQDQSYYISVIDSVGGNDWQYFSAVCWMFGRKLYDKFKVPIGLISSNYGGTPVEAWSSPDALRKCNIPPEENESDER